MGYKRVAGRIAADTLGYIGGNLYGAAAADILYQKMTNGTPTPRGKRKASNTPSGGIIKKRVVRGSARSGRIPRTVKFPNSIRRSLAPANDNVVHSTRRGKPVSSAGRRKPVAHLKPAVREAVKRIVRGTEIRGTYVKTVGGYHWFGGNTNSTGVGGAPVVVSYDNNQKVEYIPVADPFSPYCFIDAASILWNNKTPSSDGQASTTGNFSVSSTQVYVRDSYCTVTFKSNSKRAYHYKLLICAPRRSDVTLDPRGDWDIQLNNEREASTNAPNDAGANVLTNYIHTLNAMPFHCASFKKNWNVETISFVLQPGQVYVHRIQGPKAKLLDYAKYWHGDVFQVCQKNTTRFGLAVYHGDMVATSTGAFGYFEEIGDASADVFDGKGVLITQKITMDLTMPEQTGFKYNAAVTPGSVQLNTQRRYAYANTVFMSNRAGTVVRVDDEDPSNAYDPT